jgi:hypothetical protein
VSYPTVRLELENDDDATPIWNWLSNILSSHDAITDFSIGGSDDDITYHFNLPCTVSLWGKPASDEELGQRLAATIRDQLMDQDAQDIGNTIQNIRKDT